MMNTKGPIELSKIVLHKVKMKLKSPFTTSFGSLQEKEFFVVEAIDPIGRTGWGESVAFSSPWYSEETVKTNEHIMEDFLIPLLFQSPIQHPDEISERFSVIKRNPMAKAALEGAVWDLYARMHKLPLWKALGGVHSEIEVGVSIGIQPSNLELLNLIESYLEEGYKRIKIKIKPNYDIEVIKEIRKHFPNIPLMADANSAYTLEDIDVLKRLDDFELMMIEQPLAHDDIVDHATLQRQLHTPICLDESIHSFEDARKAVELGSCRIINIKIGRVGGLTEAIKIHNYCKEKDIPVWCGGMLEAGIGRAHNIAITTLQNFILPGDTSGSSRYWEEDIITPEVTMKKGYIKVPIEPGIGYTVDRNKLEKYTIQKKEFIPN